MVYYNKLLGLWDQLLMLAPLDPCGCTKGTETLNWYKHLQTYQFLTRLDDNYSNLCTNILNMNLFPDIDRVYAMVVQEESRKTFSESRDIPQPRVFTPILIT